MSTVHLSIVIEKCCKKDSPTCKERISQIGLIESTISGENSQQNILNRTQFLATADLTQRAKVATGFNK